MVTYLPPIFDRGSPSRLPATSKESVRIPSLSDLFTFVIMLCAIISLVVTLVKRKK